MQTSDIVVPDLTAPVIGLRGWPYSEALYTLKDWDPGVNEAHCLIVRTHEAPMRDCACGFYAYHDLDRFESNQSYGPLWGVVAGWGKMCVAKDGFRAQYAEILAFAPDPNFLVDEDHKQTWYDSLTKLAEEYEVPLLTSDELLDYGLQFGDVVPEDLRPGKKGKKPLASARAPVATFHRMKGPIHTPPTYAPTHSAPDEISIIAMLLAVGFVATLPFWAPFWTLPAAFIAWFGWLIWHEHG